MHLFEPMHLLIVAIIVLLFFGGKKIPELMRGLGQGMGELQKGLDEGKRTMKSSMESLAAEKPEPAVATGTSLKVEPAKTENI